METAVHFCGELLGFTLGDHAGLERFFDFFLCEVNVRHYFLSFLFKLTLMVRQPGHNRYFFCTF